jgi:hypothetical protein
MHGEEMAEWVVFEMVLSERELRFGLCGRTVFAARPCLVVRVAD